MNKSIVRVVLEPVLTRIGTALAGLLIGAGLASSHGPSIENLVVALGLLGVDLVSRWLIKKRS